MPIYCEVSPLRPKISMHILHTVFYVISERVNKVVEWKERRKEGTYVKRAPTIPILALEFFYEVLTALNPSLSQLSCNEPWEPINPFHTSRPSEVARYWPSAISEYRESACLWMTMNLSCWWIFIPRQILEKDVFQ